MTNNGQPQGAGPVRMCCICRQRQPKASLHRHVQKAASGDGKCADEVFQADPAQRLPGRGVYVCDREECRDRFLRRKAGRKKRKQGEG